ncbi:cation-transporting ATPase [Brachybacterium vulturis]|uniref:Cation-transporting ATPase n=1 Tax=Brachybacterium vulturis TaxID=2017484 RepID=A0A291GSS0_9MICO|nr:cation-transporting ATPase [Brachybacterium vulturis]ATG53066.1 cation-transporting ATPase [Brachybacterium vulturis]
MSTFRRLLGTAQKALDAKSSGSSHSGQGSDWRSLVRSAADSLTGDSTSSSAPRASGDASPAPSSAPTASAPGTAPSARGESTGAPLSDTDRRAIARYDYLVRTAEPDQLERVHREAFEKLTPQQRTQLTATMRSELPEGERPRTDAPQDLARSATRLGALDPRRLTRLLGSSGGGGRRGAGAAAMGAGAVGAGALGVGGLLAAVAGGAVVTSVGGSLLQDALGSGIDIDALSPDLAGDLSGMFEGVGGLGGLSDMQGLEGVTGMEGMSDGVGGAVAGAGEQVSGLGDRISDLGLGDFLGR